jgi:hypothetical protein
MTHQYKLTLLAASLVAAFVTNGAVAGQIQASTLSIAREVITTDTQPVLAPSVSYRFVGDVDARSQNQTFQVQFTLMSGAWAVAPTATAISVSDGVSGLLADQNVSGAGDYNVTNIGLSADKKTLWATINVWNAAATDGTALFAAVNTRLIKQPIISLNVSSNNIAGVNPTNTTAARGTVNGLKTVVGDLVADFNASGKCVDSKELKVDFKHFTALSDPGAQATEITATPDEHLRGGAKNDATLIRFPTALLVNVATSTGDAKISPAGANLIFAGTATGTPAFVNATSANLGSIALTQPSTAYDTDLINNYTLAGGGAGILAAATASSVAGRVEASSLDVAVAATNGFVVGGTLHLNTNINCGAGTIVSAAGVATAITAGNAAGPITLSIGTAQLNAALGAAVGTNPVYVCYGVAGVAVPIPQSAFSATATLVKSAAGANMNEQNNVCAGTLYSLGGGVKIDVRNYANSKDPNGWMSVIRLINNNETRAIDVWGQLIHPDGTYGPWGLLTAGQNAGHATNANKLAPRAVLNLTAAQVDPLLTSAPAHATAANNGSAVPVAATTGSRLRVTSNAGSTLRVQNYLYNPDSKNFIEASSSQAVDFEGSVDRAPVNEGQYQDQDAQKGINGK